MMRLCRMNRLLAVAAVAAAVPAVADDKPAPRLALEYSAPSKAGVVGAPIDHVTTMRSLFARLDRELRLPRTVPIKYRECGEANSFYRGDGSIDICHELWDSRRRLYSASGLAGAALETALRGAMTFTFFHEYGHALHRELGLPLVGRWEDAVDELATIAMIGRGLGDAAAHAALGHYMRSQQPRYGHEIWDEHSAGGQRGFAIACLLYGSDATRYGDLAARIKIPQKRLARCVREYPHRARTWAALLRSHVR
jgi:hypothetical protein